MFNIQNKRKSFFIYLSSAVIVVFCFYAGIFYVNNTADAATDYTGQYGTGDRTSIITVTQSGNYEGSNVLNLVDGAYAFETYGSGDATGSYLQFELTNGAATFIEAKFYQNGTGTHGEHQWQGSNNGSDWTNIGSSFTLGGTSPQTQTELSGNTTAYTYYRLLGISGSFNLSRSFQEFQFGVAPNTAPSISGLSVNHAENENGDPDGTGNVAITVTVDDANDDDLNIGYRYEALSGSCSAWDGNQATTTMSSTVSATYGSGSITVDNDQENGAQLDVVTTASGANTVTSTWDTATQLPTADGTYCVYAFAHDGTDMSSTVVTTTVILDNVAPTAPGALTVNSTSTTEVVLDFGSASSDTNFEDYTIIWNASTTAPILDSSDGEVDVADEPIAFGSENYGGESSVTITGLATSTQYSFNIYALDSYENKASSTALIFYTLATAPGTPTVTASTTSIVNLVIDEATNSSSTHYSICTTDDGSTCATEGYVQEAGNLGDWQGWSPYSVLGESEGFNITGLTANTEYTFLTYARNGDSIETSSSASSSVYTLATTPSSLTATVDSATAVTLSWTGDGTSYTISDTLTDIASGETSTSYNVTGLTCNTAYTFKVKALNGDSIATAYSDTASVTTSACPTSGGGGGSSASPPAPVAPVVVAPVTTKAIVETSVPQVVSVGNTTHTVTVNSINANGTVTVTIESDPITLTLAEGEEQLIDTDSDGIKDLFVKYNGLLGTENVDLTLSAIDDLEFSINRALSETDSIDVTLYFNSSDVTQIAISNTSDFTGSSFTSFNKTKSWKLTEGNGIKTVYVKLRTDKGGTKIISDTIKLTDQLNDADETEENETTCPLITTKPYKHSGHPGVYYITDECRKRPFTKSKYYFSHFDGWNDVIITDKKTLDAIDIDPAGSMSFGKNYHPPEGQLFKVPDDPRVYVFMDGQLRWIQTPKIFERLGFAWKNILSISETFRNMLEVGIDITE